MYTYQMIGVADGNGRIYESKFGTYSKDTGFVFNKDVNLTSDFINGLFHDDLWKLKVEKAKPMTLQDIERELGYRVRIIAPEEKIGESKEETNKRRKDIDDEIDMFKRIFGINLDPDMYK